MPRRRDIAGFYGRRSIATPAAHQLLHPSIDIGEATTIIEEAMSLTEPIPHRWWPLIATNHSDTRSFGDVSVKLGAQGRNAEIAYTFEKAARGRGYATEAVVGLAQYIFDEHPVTRIQVRMHPADIASARVAERAGFDYEGTMRLSLWVGKTNHDMLVYAATRDSWRRWFERPTGGVASVELVEIDTNNYRNVARLSTHHSQLRFVSPVSDAFAAALFPPTVNGKPVESWLRAALVDGDLVGFVMTAEPGSFGRNPLLRRLLVDRRYQRRGVGDKILNHVIDRYRTANCESLAVHWTDGPGSPAQFYLRRGFRRTGKLLDGEVEALLSL